MDNAVTIFPPQGIDTVVAMPPSKSMVMREMVMDALAAGTTRNGDGQDLCDDIRVMARGLRPPDSPGTPAIDAGASGTALRLLAAYWALKTRREIILTGTRRLLQRPVEPLLNALREMGADIGHGPGSPIRIRPATLTGGQVAVDASLSSQFATALLLIAPAVGGMTLRLTGDIASRTYIDLTLDMMNRRGIDAHWTADDVIDVPAGEYLAGFGDDEGDWSAAAFWLALQAMAPEARIGITSLRPDSTQGDRRMLTLLGQMGWRADWQTGTLRLRRAAECCCATYADLGGTPDLVPVLTVMLCLTGRPFHITGTDRLRIKESDRLEALRDGLRRLGYDIRIQTDAAIDWHFERCTADPDPIIDSRGDHRIAMAFALASLTHPGIRITGADAVGKSYPMFWRHLSQAGFTVTPAI